MSNATQLKATIKTLKTDRILESSNGVGISINGTLFGKNSIQSESLIGFNDGIKIDNAYIKNKTLNIGEIKPISGESSIKLSNIDVNNTSFSCNNPIFINGTKFNDKHIFTNKINNDAFPTEISGIRVTNGIIHCKSIIQEEPTVVSSVSKPVAIPSSPKATKSIEEPKLQYKYIKEGESDLSILNTKFTSDRIHTKNLDVRIFTTDAIFEKTAYRGVTVDGCLLKKGDIVSTNGKINMKKGVFEEIQLGEQILSVSKWETFDIDKVADNKSRCIVNSMNNSVSISLDFIVSDTKSEIPLYVQSNCVVHGTIFVNDRAILISTNKNGDKLIFFECKKNSHIRGSITYEIKK